MTDSVDARAGNTAVGFDSPLRYDTIHGMPELPDVVVYIEALERRILGQPLEHVHLTSPFVLRTVDPPIVEVEGRRVERIVRLGKRIVFWLEGEIFLVVYLMTDGRFRWRDRGTLPPKKLSLAAFDFPTGTLLLTEAGTRKRASLHVVRGERALYEHDPGGLEVLEADIEVFRSTLLRENHTLKRLLTDPRLFSGIGNAYSDEILHRARLSPIQWSSRLDNGEIARLFEACRHVLHAWTERLRRKTGDRFPEKVTAFRPGMAVHGRYLDPCPVCQSPVQRIAYAANETNYCAQCQTGGRLLADRSLSRLLKGDWPRSLEELEDRRTGLSEQNGE